MPRDMNAELYLTFVAIAGFVKEDWAVVWNQKLFPYNYKNSAFVVLPAVGPILRRSTVSVKFAEDGLAELRPNYHAKYRDYGMMMETVKKV